MNSTKFKVSIVICTRDRAESLRDTLTSVGESAVPPHFCPELLVVDNGSSDCTLQVVRGAPLKNMPVRYFYEDRRGQCFARNRALLEANGDIFLFTDDDTRVPHDWLARMCQPILENVADATQGEIEIAPHLQPSWLTNEHRRCLTEIGNLSEQHAREPFMVGANMAFSRNVLNRVPAFETSLGPGASGFMDDTLFYLQLVEAGYRIKFVKGGGVEHHFDTTRLTRDDQLRAAAANGRSAAWVMHHWAHDRVPWRRLRLLKNFCRLIMCRGKWLMGAKVGFNPMERLYAERFWLYKEMGRLSSTPRCYQERALRRNGLANDQDVQGV